MLFSDDHAARMLHDDPEGYRRRLDEYLGFGRGHDGKRFARNGAREYPVSPLLNTVVCGDCRDVLDRLPERSVDLVFTSPPYFNARPELGWGAIPKCRYAAVRLECFFVDGCVDISSPSSSAFNSARHVGGSQRHSVFRSLAIASRV